MKITKKLLAVVMALAMVAAFAAMAFAANPTVKFNVTPLEDGEAIVTMYLVDAVGFTSGSVKFNHDAKVTDIEEEDGADVEGAKTLKNDFNYAFNPDINPADCGFYFKEELYDSAKWDELAADSKKGKDVKINGSNFEALVFTFSGEDGAVVTVTGSLKMKDGSVVDVSDSFTLKAAAPVTTTEAPKPVTTTEAPKPVTTTEAPKPVTTTEAPKPVTTTAAPKPPKPVTTKVYDYDNIKVPTTAKANTYDANGNRILGYDVNGQAIIGTKLGQFIYSTDTNARYRDENGNQYIVPDSGANNNGKSFVVCACGDAACKCTNKDCKCNAAKDEKAKCEDPNCKCNAAAAASTTAANVAKTTAKAASANVKTDGGKNTGDNSVLAIVAGVVALAGAAFVVTKKRR